jgi:large subunit ribosomal protein L19e|tara:strand:+ start:641 stop:1096 length:456 start_codon:yes stop_codon:yes gene_type:complete
MKLNVQKRIAGSVLKCSPKRVTLDKTKLSDIKEAITKVDINSLIKEGVIKVKPIKGVSRVRARKRALQRSKGRQKGFGKRKGKKGARLPRKQIWMNKVRTQRKFIKELKDKNMLTTKNYRELYQKVKGGYFRSKRHVKLYLDEKKLVQKKK